MNEKFFEKNKDKINDLNLFIEKNRNNIQTIIVSVEMYYALSKFKEATNYIEEDESQIGYKYMNKRIIKDCYIPSGHVSFIMKNNTIKFNTPCLCGIYQDEEHP